MTEFVSISLKKTNDVDLVKPFKALLLTRSASGDKKEDFSDAIGELNRLRQSATSRAIEKQESYLEIMTKYHDQLFMLESKFPPQDITIPFKWKDAFDKGSLFGGKLSLTISSLTWERFCMLFNVAALQSQIGALQNVHTDEGLKTASRLFQQASGILQHLKSLLPAALGPNEPTPDVQPDCLAALSALMLAQGQEAITMKAINDKMKDGTVAKLASQTSEYYSEAQKLLQKDTVRNLWERDWLPRVSARTAFYSGAAQYYQSRVCNNEKRIGEEIARCQSALDQLKMAQTRFSIESAVMTEMCSNLQEKANRAVVDAKKDNDFIYHERIPDASSLAAVPKAAMAKPIPVQGKLNPSSKDLFDGLAPVAVQQAVLSYEARKAELVNMEIGRLREANQLLNGVLASLNLPAALEDKPGGALPPSLKERATAVRNAGGKDALEKQLRDLPEMLTRNDEILTETERMLRDERSSDDQLRAQFAAKWIRTPSEGLTEKFRTDLQKYRNIINTARTADGVVRAKYESSKHGIDLMSLPEEELASKLPSGASSLSTSGPLADRLRELMKSVTQIQRERENLEKELSSKTADMKAAFTVAMQEDSNGQIDEEAISSRVLGEVYGPLQVRARENLKQQQIILAEVEKVAGEWLSSRTDGDNERDTMMKELASAYDMFIELSKNLGEGGKFYTDLTQLLVVFQSKVSDFCFARKTEKEELLKDLTASLASSQLASPPNAPSHHEESRSAPPRPPPPSVHHEAPYTAATAPPTQAGPSPYGHQGQPHDQQNLPYPIHMTGMPLPAYPAYPGYGQVPGPQSYPAYTPMPGGYNPYASPAYQASPGQQFPGQYLVDRVFDMISHIPIAGPQVKKYYDEQTTPQNPPK